MKKIYFLGLALTGLLTANAQLIIQDDFESYPIGPYFGEHWSNWSETSGAENILIADNQASSGSKSGYISSDGVQDPVLHLGTRTSGVYTLQWDMFVDFAAWAFYGLMKEQGVYSDPNFSINMRANFYEGSLPDGTVLDGKMVWVTDNGAGQSAVVGIWQHPEESWFTLTHVFNLDNNTIEIKANGETVYSGEYYNGENKIGQVDFWSMVDADGNALNSYYIDNVVFAEGELSVEEIESKSSISVYPTVANEVINVSAKSNISEVTVFNTAGQQVAKVAGNGTSVQVNVSALPAGVYVVKTVAGKEIKTTKVVVK